MSDATLLEEARAAINAGNMPAARDRLRAMQAPPPMVLAQVCARLGDAEGEAEALSAQLATEPRHLTALLAMGALKARGGDDRGATAFFRAALNQATVSPPPPNLHAMLQRASAHVEASTARFEAHLAESVGDAGKLPRVAHAMNLLTGKTPLFLQQPSMFYFPGLPQRAFYERDEFDWLADVEAATPLMQAELRARLAGGEDFRPYVETRADRPAPNNPLKDDASWGAHYFWNNGAIVDEHAAAAPATMAALARAPIPVIKGRSPMALWSLLKPGTHIQPHHGMLNTRLICHIPLVVNAECALRVGPETRSWEPGKALIFDDSFEHEAWNRGQETRVILLFEIWRPEICPEERAALTRLFETIDELEPGQAGNGF
jgi:aspartyl/asparaginyl beta-hydroxylase (cupin superfamily)